MNNKKVVKDFIKRIHKEKWSEEKCRKLGIEVREGHYMDAHAWSISFEVREYERVGLTGGWFSTIAKIGRRWEKERKEALFLKKYEKIADFISQMNLED